ncbi:unnamed protein product [Notodromas monacha]|uniref:Innexin n=1 Tax=Notodromas monacha TaxID=399045 RepID=A0A7R9GIW5_9CRUS|nr:unnamed protein product [Notodromas monacha]CAG0922235.1 unnamed protein product [Notodromas monacha]
MLGSFGAVASNLKPSASPRADTFVFKLHYKITVAILIAAMLLNCMTNFIGNPINCMLGGSKIPEQTINMYCWISSTFSIPMYWTAKVGEGAPHPGLGNPTDYDTHYHAYYQWVPFFLFLQALLFYGPHYIWRLVDNGKMKCIVQGLDSTSMILKEEERKKKEKILGDYFIQNLHGHNSWSFKFVFCEILNFVNVIGNIYFTDKFLGYQFTTYGSEAVSFLRQPLESRVDPMVKVFPRVTKCTFHMYGPSGSIQQHDALCVLALNIINEKIFLFIWFWFVILAVITGLQLVHRFATLGSPLFRHSLLSRRARFNTKSEVDAVIRKCQFGDWFLLSSLDRNLNSFVFSEFMSDLALELDTGSSNNMEMAPLNPSAPEYSLASIPDKEKFC